MIKETGITLFVYNRPYHTQKVLEGLKANNISKLYIFSDGSKNEKDKAAVKEVRSLIKNIDWCEIKIHISPANKGLADSVIDGVNYVLSKHERIIVLEDDCIPSNDFISFMEVCFEKYEESEEIMSISGYNPPINIPTNYKYDIYFSYRLCSSGWGTWKRAWNFFDRNNSLLNEIEESKDFKRRVLMAGKDLIPMLEKQIKGEVDSWAVFYALNIVKNNGFCINPVRSRISNIGFDNSGIHSKPTRKFEVDLYKGTSEKLSLPNKIVLHDKIVKQYRSFYIPSFKKEIRLRLIRMFKFLKVYRFLKTIRGKNEFKNENNTS